MMLFLWFMLWALLDFTSLLAFYACVGIPLIAITPLLLVIYWNP